MLPTIIAVSPVREDKVLNPAPQRDILPTRIELRCACGSCHLPFAYFEGGMLVIISWHNHERHTNRIPLQMAISLSPPVTETI